MSGFSAAWLALREPYDLRVRNPSVVGAMTEALTGRPWLNIVDLACGTGANLRALSPHFESRQNWRMVDNDLSLLARVPQPESSSVTVATVPVDLNHDLEAALDGALDLIVTSALFDLVSEAWLQRLTIEAAARWLPVYAALSYDGRIAFNPADASDEQVTAAFNAHQRTDKGFGPALGPAAARAAVDQFERVGYTVVRGNADWSFGPHDREIQIELLSGWASAARETGEVPLADVVGWLTRRRDLVAAGRSSIQVGHLDLFAYPTGTR